MQRFTRLGVLDAHPGGAWAVAAVPPAAGAGADTPEGAFLTGGIDGCVRLWRPPAPSASSPREDTAAGGAADADVDAKAAAAAPPLYVATAAGGDTPPHPAGVLSIAVAAAAPVALSSSLDGTVCRWRLSAAAGAPAAADGDADGDAGGGGDGGASPPAMTLLPPITRDALKSWAVALTPTGSVAAVAGQADAVPADSVGAGAAASGISLYALGDGGGDDGSVAAAPSAVAPPAAAAGAMCLALTPLGGDGSLIAAAYSNGTVAVVDVAAEAVSTVLPPAVGAVRSLAAAAGGGGGAVPGAGDGGLWAAADDGLLYLYDTAAGVVAAARRGHRGSVLGVAADAGGGYVATGGADRAVRVWEGRSGREVVHADDAYGGAVWGVAYGGVGGGRLAAAADDGGVALIDASRADAVGGGRASWGIK